MMSRNPLRALLVANALLIASCSGAIQGGSSGERFNGPGSAAGSGAASGGAGTGGGAGASGAGAGGNAGSLPPEQDPGRVTLHRLNRVEYANTVRDLLGTTLRPSDDFPADDRGYGFDNIADVLSLSPLQVEMYVDAAETLIDDVMVVAHPVAAKLEAEVVHGSTGGEYGGIGWNLNSAGYVQGEVAIATEGTYVIKVRAFQQAGGDEAAKMKIYVDNADSAGLETKDVIATESAPDIYQATTTLQPGTTIVGASFTNDFYVAATDTTAAVDRNLIIDRIEVEGPTDADADNPLRARIMVCQPDPASPQACLRQVIEAFGRRAYRRPLEAAESTALLGLATDAIEEGDDVDTATKLALQAMLVSPNFLFRVEHDADPASLATHALNDHELASRLSYFLWSSMPDEELLALADDGGLNDDGALREQVTRMLADEKSKALLDNFGGQWLFIRALDNHVPDYAVFPDFDESLRVSMRAETEAFVRDLLFGELPMNRMLDADFSYLNERLATHYGIDGVTGDELQRTSLAGVERRGLLTQASILMVTSYATRTSPVKRGKWVLEQLLCSGPPPPPPGVEGLMKEDVPTGSIRERMEAHRKNPVCASCHKLMDPIGFGFEHYDGIGKYRDTDNSFAIDDSGELPSGETFEGPLELATLLTNDARLPRCITEQLMTYALGRGTERYDDDDIDKANDAFVAGGYLMPELITQVVLSDAFRMRRGEVEEP